MTNSTNPREELSSIQKCLSLIQEIEISVRDFINTGRHQRDLLKDSEKWNQICSSLDTIGDTIYSIQDYVSSEYPKSSGLKYIYTYGLLQALFIQQDAVKNLADAFSIPYKASDKLLAIRSLRNSAIGHPTKNNVKNTVYYNYISRMTLSKWGFTLLQSSGNEKNEFIDVNLLRILKEQLSDIQISYSLISEILKKADQMHLDSHKDNLIRDIFHESVSYLISKVFEGIHSPTSANRSFSLQMLQLIENMYIDFENALLNRKELNEYTKYDLDEFRHAISKLKEYLSGKNKTMTESDARIYGYYLRGNHKRFVDIASEIDKEYSHRQE